VESWATLGGTWITAPHAVSLGPHRLAVFAVGIDHRVYCRWREDGDWGDWERLGGPVRAITPPFAVDREARRLDLFVVNLNHRIYRRCWEPGGWSDWEDLAGEAGGQGITAPHGVSSGPSRLDLFALGTDRQIWHKWWEGERPSADWVPVGYDMISAPHAVSSGPGRMDIFAVGADNELKHRAWRVDPRAPDKDPWAPEWESLEGSVSSIPYAVARESGRLDAFGVGDDRVLYQQVWEEDWGPWRPVVPSDSPSDSPPKPGSLVISPPRALCWRPDRIDLFHVGEDAAVRHMAGDGEKWSNWAYLEGPAFSPVSVVLQHESQLELFVLGEDSAVWHRTLPALD
jgi:hypothetical protein